MTFDPISYSVAKRAKNAVIPSSSEIAEKYQIWLDLNCEKPRIYNPNKSEWGYLKYELGYLSFDNTYGGAWTNYINVPISTAPSESIQYKIEIDGDHINVYSNDVTKVLVTGTGASDFWSKVQVDGKDIRIFDETYEQNYFWIEEFDYNNQKAIIWIKLNAGQTQLNIAYGNSDCGVSSYCNGDMTFEFFDDFEGDSIDTNKWIIYENGFTVSNSELITTTFAEIDSIKTFTGNIVFGAKFRRNGNNNHDTSCGIVKYDATNTRDGSVRFGFGIHDYGDNFYHEFVNFLGELIGSADDNYHIYEYRLYWDGTQTVGVYTKDGSSNTLTSVTNYTTDTYRFWTSSGSCVVDWIYVRKYLSTDLTFGTPTIKQF